jgi:hypothetical protein
MDFMDNQDPRAGFHVVHHDTHDPRERGDAEFPPAQTLSEQPAPLSASRHRP